tara:strand:+ start:73603 stop:74469 length:867 start_codon:yes stop_codon:yes gene_type:complete
MDKILFFIFISITTILYSQNIDDCNSSKNSNRVVVAGGSIAEIMYFLNLQNKIVGVDVTSVFPSDLQKFPSIGYVRNLSTEGILSLQPTLVIGEDDMGPPHIIKQLKAAKIDLEIVPEEQTAEGILKKIYCVAKILGLDDIKSLSKYQEKDREVKNLNKLKQNNLKGKIKIMLVLSMKGTSPVVAGKGTSGNAFIKMIGAENIFNSVEGWKPVTLESIIKEDPDFIIIPNREMHANSNTEELIENPFFSNTTAGKNGSFILVDGMAILGFGPRTISSALEIAIEINKK